MTAPTALTPRHRQPATRGDTRRLITHAVTPSNTGNAPQSPGVAHPDWRTQAECRKPQYDAELWFPVGTTGAVAIAQAEEAKKICRRCPVQVECLERALGARPEHGVWGGFTEIERNSILRRRRCARAAANPAAGPRPKRPRWTELLTYRGVVEEQLAAGVSRRRLAESLGFDRDLIAELIALIEKERKGNTG